MSLDFMLQVDTGGEYPATIYNRNITHNLTTMAKEAGIYRCLWRSQEDHETAGEIVPLLEEGLKKLKADPEHYKQFDSPNGWGIYDHFIPFVEEVLEACRDNPKAQPYSCV